MKAVKIVVAKFCSCVIPLTDKAKPFNKSMNLNFETRFLMRRLKQARFPDVYNRLRQLKGKSNLPTNVVLQWNF